MSDVFISYRGADRVLARKLEQRIRSRWGARVFRDETGVTPGANWAQEITNALAQSRVLLALVGPGWFVSSDKEVEDWVRKELLAAVNSGKPVLPVLVGKSEELRPKLAQMPEAFQKQAVVVGPDLAGFDLHEIAQGLSHLGAFQAGEAWSLAARRHHMVPKQKLQEAKQRMAQGDSLFIIGRSGSGRNALIRELVSDLRESGDTVAYHGLNIATTARHTHAVIAGWINSLASSFRSGNRKAGVALVESILASGPDLLSRHVINAGTLLPLGNTEHDQRILQAVRRATDRWAPFPPSRLMNQSREVLVDLYTRLRRNNDPIIADDKKLVFIVDHFDSVDSISKDLVCSLVADPIGKQADVQFIVAAYQENRERHQFDFGSVNSLARIHIEAQDGDHGPEDWWTDHIVPWLNAHHVRLKPRVEASIRDEPTPYQALAKLWYFVDNGFVREPLQTKEERIASQEKSPAELDPSSVVAVEWDFANQPVEVSSGTLLDHMIQENIPQKFRPLVRAGALLGRVFSFRAAYAAVQPPSGEKYVHEALSSREKEDWSDQAATEWKVFQRIDPDQSVVRCSVSNSGEHLVSISQADLVAHLQNQIRPQLAAIYHRRLARYLSDPIEPHQVHDYGHQYHLANQAAEQWCLAGCLREGADAHRKAAEIAERSLAYGESRKHYHSAIRLYTQLLAERRNRKSSALEHEDLSLLANCYYRVGQTTRLSGHAIRSPNEGWSAKKYLDRALDTLSELRERLLGDELDEQWKVAERTTHARGIPAPDLVRHHIRVYDAIAGHVTTRNCTML